MQSISTPYSSRKSFLTHGVTSTLVANKTDCSICREPLKITLPTTQNPSCSAILAKSFQEHFSAPRNASLAPEPAVQILQCSHIFGKPCLESWFAHSTSNRCPMCNLELFPQREPITLIFRHPTRALREEFASGIERRDPGFAKEIRRRLMSDWVVQCIQQHFIADAMRQGYEVVGIAQRPAKDEGDVERIGQERKEEECKEAVDGTERAAEKEATVAEEVPSDYDEDDGDDAESYFEMLDACDNGSDDEMEDYPSDHDDMADLGDEEGY